MDEDLPPRPKMRSWNYEMTEKYSEPPNNEAYKVGHHDTVQKERKQCTELRDELIFWQHVYLL